MSTEISHHPFTLIVAIFILAIVGPIATFGICLQYFLYLVIEFIHTHNDIQATQKSQRRALEHSRRRAEISVITACIAQNLERLTASEITKLHTAEDDVRRKHKESIATIRSLVATHVLADAKEKEKQLDIKSEELEQKSKELEKKSAELEREIRDATETKLAAELKACQAAAETIAAKEMVAEANRRVRKAEERASDAEQEARDAEEEAREAERGMARAELKARVAKLKLANAREQSHKPQPVLLPDSLKDIDPLKTGFKCIGITQKGQRCGQSFISTADKVAAAKRLQKMKSEDPGDSYEYPQLLELADFMLCPRWHRYAKPQGERIASEWYDELRPARRALRASTAQKHR